MRKTILIILFCETMVFCIAGCGNKSLTVNELNEIIENNINTIVNDGPITSSNPYDYVNTHQDEYNELLKYPKETFEYSIKDLIDTNANNGLKSYIEALLCSEINKNFEYDFESAGDFLIHYKEFLTKSDLAYNDYDKYSLSLIEE